MKNYKVVLKKSIPDCREKVIPEKDLSRAENTVKNYIENNWRTCLNNPEGRMKYEYVTPAGGYNSLWDWDTFFMCCALPDKAMPYIKGSVINLLESADSKTGKPAKNVQPDGHQDEITQKSHPYPVQAQLAYIVAERMGDFSWIEPYYNTFERAIAWFDGNTVKNGYYVWMSMYGNGIDNNPAVYGRGEMSSAGVDLASFYYRELLAMAKLSSLFSADKVDHYTEKANKLKDQITNYYFDDIDRSFYNIDCNTSVPEVSEQSVEWVTYIKFKNCATFFPLWAGAATQEQAKCMRDLIMDENEFLSVCGVRSHSKSDPIYNNVAMANPSNWQGPVWGLSTFIAAYGLARYGYKEEALEVAGRLVKTFAGDIEQNGGLHEMYNGDNGQPVMRLGFLSWNLLAYKVMDDIRNGRDCTSTGLFDK